MRNIGAVLEEGGGGVACRAGRSTPGLPMPLTTLASSRWGFGGRSPQLGHRRGEQLPGSRGRIPRHCAGAAPALRGVLEGQHGGDGLASRNHRWHLLVEERRRKPSLRSLLLPRDI